MTATHLRTTGCLALLLCSVAAVSVGYAQSTDTQDGGVVMRFGLTLGVEAQSNRTLATNDPGNSTEAFTGLSFGLSSQTRTQSLVFDLSGRLRAVNAPDSLFVDEGFANPSSRLSYRLSGATAQLNLSARLSEADLSDSNLLIDDDGSFDLILGDSTRRQSVLEARYDWNQDARVRYGAFARYEDISYRNGVATGVDGFSLGDTQRLTLGTSATLDLTTATSLNVALSYSVLDEDGVANESEILSLDHTLTLKRPDGDVTLSLGAADTENGTRVTTTIGRVFETPRASLSGEIGVTREVSGDTVLVGALGVSYPLPRGGLTFGLARNVSSSNTQDQERSETQATFGYQQALTSLSGFALDAAWAEAQDTGTDASVSNASLSATYTRTLTRDWSMDTGVSRRYSDDDEGGTATSNELFFNLRREFVTRF